MNSRRWTKRKLGSRNCNAKQMRTSSSPSRATSSTSSPRTQTSAQYPPPTPSSTPGKPASSSSRRRPRAPRTCASSSRPLRRSSRLTRPVPGASGLARAPEWTCGQRRQAARAPRAATARDVGSPSSCSTTSNLPLFPLLLHVTPVPERLKGSGPERSRAGSGGSRLETFMRNDVLPACCSSFIGAPERLHSRLLQLHYQSHLVVGVFRAWWFSFHLRMSFSYPIQYINDSDCTIVMRGEVQHTMILNMAPWRRNKLLICE